MKRGLVYGLIIGAIVIVLFIGINATREFITALKITNPSSLRETTSILPDPSSTTTSGALSSESSAGESSGGGGSGASAPREPRYCGIDDRNADSCAPVTDPVCGWFIAGQGGCSESVCVRLFVNPCEACLNQNIEYWISGECPLH